MHTGLLAEHTAHLICYDDPGKYRYVLRSTCKQRYILGAISYREVASGDRQNFLNLCQEVYNKILDGAKPKDLHDAFMQKERLNLSL